MRLNGVPVADTYAEAFDMRAVRLVVTAATPGWADTAARSATGFATSVIACGAEAGVERHLAPEETPDGRPGVAVLIFATSREGLARQVRDRVGQCVLTCATTACFSGSEGERRLPLGDALRWFGDGHQIAKRVGGRRYWRIPVMEGEFLCEADVGLVEEAVGGGNLLILGASAASARAAAERAVAAVRGMPDVVMPFPGGIVRAGSKVGGRYPGMIASTNDAWCPSLRGQVEASPPEDVGSVLEIVIDGLGRDAVAAAMRAALRAACAQGPAGGVRGVAAGNYGGRLGRHRIGLRGLLA